MNITKEQADKVIEALEYGTELGYSKYSAQLDAEALSIMRGLAEDAEPVPKAWYKVGYYHKAETTDECDFYFLDAIDGDCPKCHPCYADTAALEKPSPRAVQTEAQEREAFEAWALRTICHQYDLQQRHLTGYASQELNYLWRGWQAGRAGREV